MEITANRRTVLLGATALGLAGGGLLPARGFAAPERALDIQYGWQPDLRPEPRVSGGAILHVAPDGDDSAAGSAEAPLRSVQAGVDHLARAGSGTLYLHGGLYREAVTLDALRGRTDAAFHIRRYDDAPVTISAAEVLTGWRACEAADVAGLGISPAGLYVTEIAKSDLAHGAPYALNIFENGQWCSIATDRDNTDALDKMGQWRSFHLADMFEAGGPDNRIQAIRDARLVGRPETAFRDMRAVVYGAHNRVAVVNIDGFEPATGTVMLRDSPLRPHKRRKEVVPAYALQNAPWALQPGQWLMRDTGRTVTIVFWPRAPEHLDTRIEVSLRPYCVELGRAEHVTLEGLSLMRAAGAGRQDCACLRRTASDVGGTGVALVNCRLGESLASDQSGYGALYLAKMRDMTMRHITITDCINTVGYFLSRSDGIDMRFIHVRNIGKTAARLFGLTGSVLAFSLFENTGGDAHANKMALYLGCDRVLIYGLRTRNTEGYATYQKASRIYFGFCEFDCDKNAQGRALVSQNHAAGGKRGGADGSGDPVAGATFYYWNNSLLVAGQGPIKANSLSLGPGGSSQHHAIYNNILNGGGVAHIYTKDADRSLEERGHNTYTDLAFWQRDRFGWKMGPSERLGLLAGRLNTGRDMRPTIAQEIAPHFPQFSDWDVDIDGHRVAWNAAPIGCSVL